jgi:hypothetical protein
LVKIKKWKNIYKKNKYLKKINIGKTEENLGELDAPDGVGHVDKLAGEALWAIAPHQRVDRVLHEAGQVAGVDLSEGKIAI